MARCRSPVAWMFCIVIVAVVAEIVSGATPPAPINPEGLVNLDKNTAYTNALLCFQNTTLLCPDANTYINETGKIHVNTTVQPVYCQKCANQTLRQLDCVSKVYADFRFTNNATPQDVAKAVNEGCHGSGSFNVTATKNGATGAPHRTIFFLGSFAVTMTILGHL